MSRQLKALSFVTMIALALAPAGVGLAQMHDRHTTGVFAGAKVNGGTVTHSHEGGHGVLTLSDDFTAPETPDPHWQLVDSKGNVYLVEKLMIKPGTLKKSIAVPSYVKDVAKVQIWCAFAETLLGEASFDQPVK